jgi:hypothetical protein
MYLVGFHALAQGGVYHLVARNRAFASECGSDHRGVPVTAVALHFAMVTRQSGLNQGLDLFWGHISFVD